MTASSSPARKPTPKAGLPAAEPAQRSPAPAAPVSGTTTSSTTGSSTTGSTPPPATTAAKQAAATSEPSVGELVSAATAHLSTLVHSEIELAKLELRSSVKNAGTGAGFFGAAVVLLLFSLVYGFQALAEGIAALGVDRWLAFLIVFVLQLAAAGALAFLGIKKVKRVRAPERTIRTTRETVDYLKKSRG